MIPDFLKFGYNVTGTQTILHLRLFFRFLCSRRSRVLRSVFLLSLVAQYHAVITPIYAAPLGSNISNRQRRRDHIALICACNFLSHIPGVPFIRWATAFSTQSHRITITDFHLCLICQSFSQVNNILLRSKFDYSQLEFTFVRLRYDLGGDRPSQTTHYKLY